MDVFVFQNPTNPLQMQQGRIVKGLKSKMWIERYAQAGEFTFLAEVSSGIKDLMPIGSFVSHVDTTEIMVVENHEINDVKDGDSEIKVTGRGFETEFEQRIVGANQVFPITSGTGEYTLAAGYLAAQIKNLIDSHILAANVVDPDDALPYIQVVNQVAAGGENVERQIQRGSLYVRVLEQLGIQGLGIKVIRPGPWSPGDAISTDTYIAIHAGIDRTAEIIYSADTGEIESADYLWSIKPDKNAAYIFSRWVETRVVGSQTGVDRRWAEVDASDLDQNLSSAPVGAALDTLVAKMQQRGLEALALQNSVALTKAEVSKNTNKAAYRKDFDVGDYITVNGSYNESSTMQISEYVEIEDETGGSGYPTLAVV